MALVAVLGVAAFSAWRGLRPRLTEVPTDFKLELSEGPVAADMGLTKAFALTAGGTLVVTARQSTGCAVQEFALDRTAVLGIAQAVVDCQFFGMNEWYDNPKVHDGDSKRLEVTMDGQSHKVSLVNQDLWRFDPVRAAISGALEGKSPKRTGAKGPYEGLDKTVWR